LSLTANDVSFAVMGGGGDKLMYALDRTRTRLRRIDVYSLRVMASVTTPALSNLAFPTGAPLYATGALGTQAFVERLDETTLRPVWRRPTAPDPVIAAEGNQLWIQSGAALERIGPSDGTVLESFILHTSNRVALALTSDALYVATTPPGGGHATIETRDPDSGLVTSTFEGVEGASTPQLVPTPQGLWTVYPTGDFASMELYRVNGAVPTPARNINEAGSSAARLAYEPALSPVLWLDRAQGTVACLDPTTAAPIATIIDRTQPRLIATDQSDVLLSISGYVGIFRAHDLCPRIAP
jgi:outer membrane protein assembly factor BamB